MIVVIDSNVLISALIKDSITRKILAQSGWVFYYPELAFQEVRKYKELILQKSDMNEKEYDILLNLLLKQISLIPEERFSHSLKGANTQLGKIDPDDVVFLALAMSIEQSVIWSNDAHFQKQDKVKTLTTEEMVKLHKVRN